MKNTPYDIYKAAGLIIIDRKVLATRSKGKAIFVQPGGKLELGETELKALERELREELGIKINLETVEKLGDYYAQAAGQEEKSLKLAAYIVHEYKGTPTPQSEVEELILLNSTMPKSIEIASIMLHDIIPELKKRNLID